MVLRCIAGGRRRKICLADQIECPREYLDVVTCEFYTQLCRAVRMSQIHSLA